MKKTVYLWLSLLLTAVLLTGCGEKTADFPTKVKKDITHYVLGGEVNNAPLFGTWCGELNFTQTANDIWSESELAAQFPQIDDFRITAIFQFREDGTYSLHYDPDSVEAAIEVVASNMAKHFAEWEQSELDAMGINATAEEVLMGKGIDMQNWQDRAIANMSQGLSAFSEVLIEGQYEVRGNKLYTSSSLDEPVNYRDLDDFELDGDVLIFTGLYSENEHGLYPMVLTRCEGEE